MQQNIVITMAGRGSRFHEAGYTMPKYEIIAHGRSLFDWSLLSLGNFLSADTRLIFVCLAQNQSRDYVLSRCRSLGLSDVHVLELDALTDGQATSAYRAAHLWHAESPLLVYNIDTYVNPGALRPDDIRAGADGWIPCMRAPGDHWSFVQVGPDGWATDFAEKTRISEHASIGLYWFAEAVRFGEAYEKFFRDDVNLVRGERYIAPLYRQLLADGAKISITDLPLDDVHVLGTPGELQQFLQLDVNGIELQELHVKR